MPSFLILEKNYILLKNVFLNLLITSKTKDINSTTDFKLLVLKQH